MKSTIIIIVLSVLITLNAKCQVFVGAQQASILQQKLDLCVPTYSIPGISATILFPGNRYWNGSSGVNDIYSLQPMDTNFLFREASVTKMFVAAMVLQMVEQNLLTLDDTVGQYLPSITNVPSNTKIKYLLNQRSGIYDHLASNPNTTSNWFMYPDSVFDNKDAIANYGSPPLYSQGTGFNYSNTNYILLGMIIEQITGNSFATELKNRFLLPYGLTQTFFPYLDSIAGPQATGWSNFSTSGVYDTDVLPILNTCSESMMFTSGALVSYPKDIAKFTRLLLNGQVINNTSLSLMKTFTSVSFGDGCNGYGYGLMRYIFGGKVFYGHAGDLSGFTQLTVHNPTDSITLTISINRNYAPRQQITLQLLSAIQQALTVGVNEIINKPSIFAIYPNPSSEYFSINGNTEDIVSYSITDISGKLVQQGQYSEKISIKDIENGIYILELFNSRNESNVLKLVKSK